MSTKINDPHEITRIRSFQRDIDVYSSSAVVRVNKTLIKQLGGRGQWVTISRPDISRSIYRQIRGAGDLSSNAIELDYDSYAIDLQINEERTDHGFMSSKLTIIPTPHLMRFFAHWRNPDMSYRIAFKLGILGIGLGILSLCIALTNFHL